ncbi:MAG TPA: BTAD domain-containing putative transcriptional regulator, partial [Longimicrobiales bacterium]|nr:BTAD domain-containing putative transcriptional regulator [Longimicrobiales bacterium]
MHVRLSALGEFRLDGATGARLPTRGKLVVLLTCLARRSPSAVRREELAALLWGDRPEALARQSLRHALLRLRRALGDDVLRVTADDACLASGRFELDVALFEAAVQAGRAADAVALWRGDFLEGLEHAGGEALGVWLDAEREGLRRKLAFALEQLVADAETHADWESGVRLTERWVQVRPLDESAHVRRLQLLALAGRLPDALAEHARLLHWFREELGIEPGSALVRIGAELERRALPDAGAAPLTPVMIGRGAAFDALVAGWRAAQGGTGAALLVEGAEGTGRTRLLQEFQAWHRTDAPGAVSLHTGATGSDEPESTARDLFAGLRSAGGLSGAADAALAEVSALVPGIRDRFPHLPEADGSAEARQPAIVDVLRDVAAEQPVLVAVDDLHLADPMSSRLLLGLAARVPPGVLLLLTATPADLDALGIELPVAPLRRVPLRPLDVADLEAFLDSMVPVAALHRR